MYAWVGPVLGIIGVVLVLGLLLKDASNFNTLLGGINSTIGQLEQAGGNSGFNLPTITPGSIP